MSKIKLLYDIEQLLMCAGKETGICRVSLEVLKRISQIESYEVYPLVTIKKGADPKQYLIEKGLEHLVPNIVNMPYLKKTTQKYNMYKTIRCWFLTKKYRKEYLPILNQFDEYISLFSPISPLVYESTLTTKLVVHDLIPILLPDTCSPSFVNKFRSWIKQVNADEVICDSQATLDDFLKLRPDYKNKKVKVAHLAADAKFQPVPSSNVRLKYGIPTEKYFLAVSDHNPRKNFMHILHAFIEFLNNTNAKDVCCVFTGPKGRNYEKLKEKIKEFPQYENKIICTGFVADEDMPALYTAATAFLYPSLYEGFGLPILEAMQCGAPVVTCNNSSLPEVGGTAAIYISETDINEMVETMKQLYQNEKIRKELSQNGIEQAKKFTWDKTVQQIFNLK